MKLIAVIIMFREYGVGDEAGAEEVGPRQEPEVQGGPSRPLLHHGHQDIPRHSM
jgi:hypothetical protein